jgi:hypothetical protein
MGGMGRERTANLPEKAADSENSAAQSHATSSGFGQNDRPTEPDLASVVISWPTLPVETKRQIAGLATESAAKE